VDYFSGEEWRSGIPLSFVLMYIPYLLSNAKKNRSFSPLSCKSSYSTLTAKGNKSQEEALKGA